jgi:hypothetical protein
MIDSARVGSVCMPNLQQPQDSMDGVLGYLGSVQYKRRWCAGECMQQTHMLRISLSLFA